MTLGAQFIGGAEVAKLENRLQAELQQQVDSLQGEVSELRGQLEQRQIRFVPQQSPYCWAYQLIARGARVINQLEAYGMVMLPEFRNWALPELRDAIDREFFLLSEAHYERYIAPKFLREGLELRV
mgnify:CR=1 FL=1